MRHCPKTSEMVHCCPINHRTTTVTMIILTLEAAEGVAKKNLYLHAVKTVKQPRIELRMSQSHGVALHSFIHQIMYIANHLVCPAAVNKLCSSVESDTLKNSSQKSITWKPCAILSQLKRKIFFPLTIATSPVGHSIRLLLHLTTFNRS